MNDYEQMVQYGSISFLFYENLTVIIIKAINLIFVSMNISSITSISILNDFSRDHKLKIRLENSRDVCITDYKNFMIDLN